MICAPITITCMVYRYCYFNFSRANNIDDLGPYGTKSAFQISTMLRWFLKDEETIGDVLSGEKIVEKKDLKHKDQIPHKYLTEGLSLEMIKKYFVRRAWRCTQCTAHQFSEIQWNGHGWSTEAD